MECHAACFANLGPSITRSESNDAKLIGIGDAVCSVKVQRVQSTRAQYTYVAHIMRVTNCMLLSDENEFLWLPPQKKTLAP
jgi:hypothetical protein